MQICGDCTNLNYSSPYEDYIDTDYNDRKFWCSHDTIGNNWYTPNQYAGNCPYFNSRSWLTTLTTQLLKMDNNNIYVETIKKYKCELENDPINNELIEAYNKYSLFITMDIVISDFSYTIANNIFNLGIKPTVKLLSEGKTKEALELYKDLVRLFIKELDYTKKKRDKIISDKNFCEMNKKQKVLYKNPFIKNM